MKVVLVIVVLAGLGAGAAWYGSDSGEDEAGSVPDNGLFDVRRGQLNVTLTENGTLVAKESRKVDADLRGQAKITFLVEEGASVEEDEVVCRLDATDLQEQLEQREMDINRAEAELKKAQTDLEIQLAENDANMVKAEIALEKAEKELERYVEADAPKERRNLLLAIKDKETKANKARKKFEDSQLLFEKEYINRTQFEEDQIAHEWADVQLEGAEKDLELFDLYTYPMTLKDREVAVSDAKRNIDKATKLAESSEYQKEVAVDEVEQRLQKLNEQRDDLVERIDKMELRAPVPGIVIYGDPRRPWNRENIRVGGEVWGNSTIVTIPDLRVMQVKLRIHEADISKLEVGQETKVTMDTYPGLVIDGAVSKIASIASGDNPWEDDPEVKKFDVEVTLGDEVDLELKPGISAKAEIFIAERPDVLFVPIQCVFLEEGRHWCYALDEAGEPVAVEVEPGMSNDSYIEIVSGLEEGRRVLLYNPNLPTGASAGRADGEDAEAVDADADAGDTSGAGSAGDAGEGAATP